jgi:hypothetical protein
MAVSCHVGLDPDTAVSLLHEGDDFRPLTAYRDGRFVCDACSHTVCGPENLPTAVPAGTASGGNGRMMAVKTDGAPSKCYSALVLHRWGCATERK